MATRSIYNNVNIKDKSLSRALVSALESAQKKKSKNVVLQKQCIELKGEKIKDIFGAK